MKLLVTGGAGFIGANFIQFWLRRNPNDYIVNFDALTYAGNLENLRDVEQHPGYTFVKGDITDPQAVNTAMNGVEAIVHFAAESHVDRSIDHPATFIKTNILGTQVLLDAALKNGIKRFHHISTDEVFGSLTFEDATKFSEVTPYNPRSPYAASKAGSDHLVQAYFHTYGLATTISNCSNNYGPYQHPEKLIPLAITNLLEGKKVPIYGDGFYVRDWLYVEDHCRAIELILKHGIAGETYCVGGMTENITNRQIVSKILQLMDKNMSMIEEVADRPGHDRRYAVDWTKINTQLGWQPVREFETGLEETINWYMEHTDWWQHVKSGEYKEYYQKQYGHK